MHELRDRYEYNSYEGIPEPDACKMFCHKSMGTEHRHYCIGKRCMAWRKASEKSKTYRGTWSDRDTDGLGWTEFGYCGLAGQLKESK